MKKVIFLIAMTFALCTSISADVGRVRQADELTVCSLQQTTFESPVFVFAAVQVSVLPMAEVSKAIYLSNKAQIGMKTDQPKPTLWIDPGLNSLLVVESNFISFNLQTFTLLNRQIEQKTADKKHYSKNIVLTRHVIFS